MPSRVEASGSQKPHVVAEQSTAHAQSRRERRNVRERQARARKHGDEAAAGSSCECNDILLICSH